MASTPQKKNISLFSLVMLNVIAVDSLRSLPFSAQYGFSLVFYYLIATVFFFIPTALIAAELATGWPKRGGIYVWVKEAFGPTAGLMVIWLQWTYNICWYPTIMSVLAATIAYAIDPSLVQNTSYMLTTVFILFMSTTLVNCFGMKVSSQVTNFAALIGSIFPMLLITLLGFLWIQQGKPCHIEMSWQTFLPNIKSIGTLVLMTNILYSMVGMEMSAIHAQDVVTPQKSYPIALLWSTIIIAITLVGGGLAIAIVIPHGEIDLITGMLTIFHTFFASNNMPWMTHLISLCIIVGILGCVSAWIIGPSKGIMIAAQDGVLPAIFSKQNRFGAPIAVLGIQAVIFTLICGIFLLMPSVNSSYWILSNVTAILSLIVYVFMFAAAVKLRYSHPTVKRSYTIPFGKVGIWVVSLAGGLMSVLTIIVGLFPPSDIDVGDVWRYEGILMAGILAFLSVPLIMTYYRRRTHK